MFLALQLDKADTCQREYTVNVGDHAVNLVSRTLAAHTINCTSHMTLWTLEAQPGQTINITTIDFTHYQITQDYMAKITDLSTSKTTLLTHTGLKHRHVTVTNGHRVMMQIQRRALEQENFIISLAGTENTFGMQRYHVTW